MSDSAVNDSARSENQGNAPSAWPGRFRWLRTVISMLPDIRRIIDIVEAFMALMRSFGFTLAQVA